jgi:reactive intermediate/imine deaminase
MTERRAVRIDEAPAPGGTYSQAIVSEGLIHTAGMGPIDPATGKVVGEDVGAQTRQVMTNLQAVLAAAGSDFGHVLKVTVHLQELKRDFYAFDAVYAGFVGSVPPVRTTVGSDLYDILVEIDVVARAADPR